MTHFETRMGSDGMIRVPEEVRAAFKLKQGDIVDFYLDESARIARFHARNLDFSDIAEMFPMSGEPTRQPMSDEDIDKEIGDYLVEDDERIKREANEWYEFQQWRRSRHKAAE